MNSDDLYWSTFWKAAIAGLVCIIAVVGGCTAHGNYLTVQAIGSGADPIKVQCALSMAPSSVNCALAAAASKD
jgi:hypothetical protein